MAMQVLKKILEADGKLNLLYNAIFIIDDILLLRHRHTSVLERVVCFPEQIFSIIFEAFIERGHDYNSYYRSYKSANGGNIPGFKKNGFAVSAVKSHLKAEYKEL